MAVNDETISFGYDASGTPQYVLYDGSYYFYLTNLQGDVTAIVNMGIKQLQYLMGHSDISVTMDTYSHVQHEAAREELLRLEEEGKTKAKIVQFA